MFACLFNALNKFSDKLFYFFLADVKKTRNFQVNTCRVKLNKVVDHLLNIIIFKYAAWHQSFNLGTSPSFQSVHKPKNNNNNYNH